MQCPDCQSNKGMEGKAHFDTIAEVFELRFECGICKKVWHGTLYRGTHGKPIDEDVWRSKSYKNGI